MATEAWPRSSWTNFRWTFLENRSEAQVWRRSWKDICGRSARLRSDAKDRWRRLEGLMRPPLLLAKTRP